MSCCARRTATPAATPAWRSWTKYVEIELRGEDPGERFPGTAIHLPGLPGLPRRPRRRARGGAPALGDLEAVRPAVRPGRGRRTHPLDGAPLGRRDERSAISPHQHPALHRLVPPAAALPLERFAAARGDAGTPGCCWRCGPRGADLGLKPKSRDSSPAMSGSAAVGQRRAARRTVAWQGRTVCTGDLEGARRRAADGAAAQHRRRRPGRPRRARRRAARRVRLPARLLPLLGARARPRRLRLRAVRRELHRRGLADDEVCIGDRYRIGDGASSRSPSRASPATGSACAWTSRGCRRCSSPTTARASTCGCSRRARSGPATRSSRSPPARSR